MVKQILQLCLTIVALVAGVSCDIQVRNFTQRLDHFDENITDIWDNNYFIDESFYQPGGPIFLYVGDMQFFFTMERLNSSHFTDIAREVGALLVGTEHRYYGSSRPVPDLTKDNLVHLNTRQALEDVASIVRFIKFSSPELEDAKVIAAGVGHGGALATWLRQGYPDLIHGAWASSAKLHAIVNFGEFHTKTTETLRIYGGLICYDRMATAFSMLEDVFQERNYTKLIEVFKLCPNEIDFEDELTGGIFFGTIATAIGFYISLLHAPGITNFCGYLERGDDPMMGLADWIYYAIYNQQGCIPGDLYDLLSLAMETEWTGDGALFGARQQAWQSCNEFGWFRSSNASDHPFGNRFPYELMFEQCGFLLNDTFSDEDIRNNIDNTNALYGGLTPNVTRVYFTNGVLDSERTISVLQDLNDEAPADLIPYLGYGADFQSMDFTDYEGLRAVQERSRRLILEWLEIDDGVTTPDGTVTTPDGTDSTPDGTVTTTDGTVTTPDGTDSTQGPTETTTQGLIPTSDGATTTSAEIETTLPIEAFRLRLHRNKY